MRRFIWTLLSVSVLLAFGIDAHAQKGGGRFGPPGGGGFGPGGFGGPMGPGGFGGPSGGPGGFSMTPRDPGQLFDFMAKGRPYFLISETKMFRDPLTDYAKRKGITSGQITRDQFKDFNDEQKAKAANSVAPTDGMRQGRGPGGPGGAPPNPEAIKQMADENFKRRDANGDGKLNVDEMNDNMRRDLNTFDKNKDGLVDRDEYEDYLKSRFESRGQAETTNDGTAAPAAEAGTTIVIDLEELDRRPTVFRAGKLPKELPPWFGELDTDKDGQVALYEWFRAQKSMDEYKTYDQNDDGFLTAEEVLRTLNVTSAGVNATSSDRPGFSFSNRTGNGGGNGGSERERGKGGFGNMFKKR